MPRKDWYALAISGMIALGIMWATGGNTAQETRKVYIENRDREREAKDKARGEKQAEWWNWMFGGGIRSLPPSQ